MVEMLGSPEFEEMLPRLLAYAARLVQRAGWAEGRDHGPGAVETEDVLHDALAACLDETRHLPEEMKLENFLRAVMWSQVSHLRRAAALRATACLDDVGEPAAPSSRRDAAIDARRLLAAVARVCAADPDIHALFTVIVDGENKRADHAAALGWSPERVKAVRVKMNRLLAAAGLHESDDDEQPRSERSPRATAPPPGGARRRTAG
jgi:DNA-directed RNA polymerase specialized sigma24 family protein